MDAVDKYELHHGTYPIAFDRRWHCGVHLRPDHRIPVHAIVDGDVVAYSVWQKPIADAHKGRSGTAEVSSNTGFVLLKHTLETGESKTLTFYSLYMHLLDLAKTRLHAGPRQNESSEAGSSTALPKWLSYPSNGVQVPEKLKVRRKDILGYVGRSQGEEFLHFEIFMTEMDFDRWIGDVGPQVQLGSEHPSTPISKEYWGHSYFVIPAGQQFVSQPSVLNAKHARYFPKLESGTIGDECKLYVEAYFNNGQRYTRSWLEKDGAKKCLTAQPFKDPYDDYEYKLYDRATALYPACPSDGYELLRFGRVLGVEPTLPATARQTWIPVPFAEGKQGYIDISQPEIQKLSDADFPRFMGWQKIDTGNTPFCDGVRCDIDRLHDMVQAVEEMPAFEESSDSGLHSDGRLARLIQDQPEIRDALRGFVCHAPSEWDATGNDLRYRQLNEAEGFFGRRKSVDPDGYDRFIKFLTQFQFLAQTPLGAGRKFWFFHPLAFIRHFRRCGWLSKDELVQCVRQTVRQATQERGRLSATAIRARLTEAGQGRPDNLYPAMSSTMRRYGVKGPLRQAHFLAQVLQETGRLECLVERGDDAYFMKYDPVTVLGKGLGNVVDDDGKRFRGRGLIQLTGRDNYMRYGIYRGKSYLSDQEAEFLGNRAFEAADAAGYFLGLAAAVQVQQQEGARALGAAKHQLLGGSGSQRSGSKGSYALHKSGAQPFRISSAVFRTCVFRVERRNAISHRLQTHRAMSAPGRLMVGLSIVLLTAASAVECRAYEAGQRHAEPLSKDFAEACALTFEVPSEIEVVLVMKEPQDSEQCVLGLNKKGVKRRPPEKATGDGYRELVDFVLEVKDVPVAQRLSEFGFVRAPEPAGTVRYVMQPLTESAKQSGYLDKKLRSFKVVEKKLMRGSMLPK